MKQLCAALLATALSYLVTTGYDWLALRYIRRPMPWSKVGFAALLTTLYGSLLANVVCMPIADKLKLRGSQEALQRALIVDGLLAIQAGQNPRVIEAMLQRYLPEGKRPVPA